MSRTRDGRAGDALTRSVAASSRRRSIARDTASGVGVHGVTRDRREMRVMARLGSARAVTGVERAVRRTRARTRGTMPGATNAGSSTMGDGTTARTNGTAAGGEVSSKPRVRVLAFEDVYDVAEILERGGVDASTVRVEQRWTSDACVEIIGAYKPDVLLLDYYMPPHTGLTVIRMMNEAVQSGKIERPKYVIGMSSESSCNAAMSREGADHSCVKWDIPLWSGWRE